MVGVKKTRILCMAETVKQVNPNCRVGVVVETPELTNCGSQDHQKLVCILFPSLIRLKILQDLCFLQDFQ